MFVSQGNSEVLGREGVELKAYNASYVELKGLGGIEEEEFWFGFIDGGAKGLGKNNKNILEGKGFFDRGRAHNKSVIHILLVDWRGVRGVEI